MISLECVLEYKIGFGETFLDITVQPLTVARNVGLRRDVIW